MRNDPRHKMPKSKTQNPPNARGKTFPPTRREFLRTAAGATLAMAGAPIAAWADHHGHPSPNSISYLDRRMYVRNMELLAHFMPGRVRNRKMQLMYIGNRRYIFQQGDLTDAPALRNPASSNKSRFAANQPHVPHTST